MKILVTVVVLFFILTGCQFQKPDYLTIISPSQLRRTMEREDILLIDVHTPQQTHIKGTDLYIPYTEVSRYLDVLPKEKNTAIYLYCEGGPMGNAAAKILHESGYQHLYNLEGGTRAWRKAGYDFD